MDHILRLHFEYFTRYFLKISWIYEIYFFAIILKINKRATETAFTLSGSWHYIAAATLQQLCDCVCALLARGRRSTRAATKKTINALHFLELALGWGDYGPALRSRAEPSPEPLG